MNMQLFQCDQFNFDPHQELILLTDNEKGYQDLWDFAIKGAERLYLRDKQLVEEQYRSKKDVMSGEQWASCYTWAGRKALYRPQIISEENFRKEYEYCIGTLAAPAQAKIPGGACRLAYLLFKEWDQVNLAAHIGSDYIFIDWSTSA